MLKRNPQITCDVKWEIPLINSQMLTAVITPLSVNTIQTHTVLNMDEANTKKHF